MEPTFRESYKLATKQAIRWFPGHMGKGIKQIQQRLRVVDCVVEVHDARIPFSGRNREFQETLINSGIKPHILVLNKKDMTEIREQRQITKEIQRCQGIEHVLFTNCKDQRCPGVRRLVPLVDKLIQTSERYNRVNEKELSVMIVGVPNVGKSSLLNVLRNRNLRKKSAAHVGGVAGITRSVMERIKISDDPLMYMVDTPGILEPCIANAEMGMKLALVGCLPDHHVGEELIADYLLYWLNRERRFDYVRRMGLQEPTDNITKVLLAIANRLGVQRKLKTCDGQVVCIPDILRAARHFVLLFRKGQLGLLNLDKHVK